MADRNLTRWNVASVVAGGALWTCACALRLVGGLPLDDPRLILLLAVLVIVPLAIPLVTRYGRCGRQQVCHALSRAAILLQPVAALCGGIALIAATGSAPAAVGATLWLLYTALLGILGLSILSRMFRARWLRLADVCLALALAYLPIGGAWFGLARLGIRPLGFAPATVLLTAVHFHVITLAALVITGCTGLVLDARSGGIARVSYRITAASLLICPLLVAAGITLTQLTGQRALESVAAAALALSLMLVAILSLRYVVPTTAAPLAKTLLSISDFAVLLAMALAVAYAVGRLTGAWTITVAQMVATHGWLNALGFGICGLLGWRLRMGRRAEWQAGRRAEWEGA